MKSDMWIRSSDGLRLTNIQTGLIIERVGDGDEFFLTLDSVYNPVKYDDGCNGRTIDDFPDEGSVAAAFEVLAKELGAVRLIDLTKMYPKRVERAE